MIRILSNRTEYKPVPKLRNSTPYVEVSWVETNTVCVTFGGGGGGYKNTILQTLYSTDVLTTLSATMVKAIQSGASFGNDKYAYHAGGINDGIEATNNRYVYANRTNNAAAGNLLTAKWGTSGTGNNVFGYVHGGVNGSNYYNVCERLTYGVDVFSLVASAYLSTNRRSIAAAGNPTQMYIGPGYNGSGSPAIMERMYFSTETTAVIDNASIAKHAYGMLNSKSYLYLCMGAGFQSVDKLNFNTETWASTTPFPNANSSQGSSCEGWGYVLGGTGAGYGNTGQKITFGSTDTTALCATTNLPFSINGEQSCG